MSAVMLDRARAFDLIAPHLNETKRAEIAAALADRIVTDLPAIPSKTTGHHPLALDLDIDDSPSREVAEFLTKHGLTGKVLVDETVRLNEFLAARPNGNRKELMRSYVVRLSGEKGGA